MVVYEVNLSVDGAIEREFCAWLDDHVRRIVALPGFTGARLLRRDPAVEDLPDDGRVPLTVQYTLRDRAALADYLERHAPALRREGLQRFPGRFQATRRVLEPERDYGA
ncbi:MAG: DUF4286 family protein [Acidobacteria bacterium]|jgi:hypothetical protein|nr:DUF4286 family protein [Acidobacteriota bacterium]